MNSNGPLIKAARRLALVAAVTPFLVPAPATADSFCGDRGDFGRSKRLTIFGLTADQQLVKFSECRPERLKRSAPYPAQDDDDVLVGIDFRVQDGELYGLGNGGGST